MRKTPQIALAVLVVLAAGFLSAQEGGRLERVAAELERLRDEAALAEKEGRGEHLEKLHARIKELEVALRGQKVHGLEAEARELRGHLEALEAKARVAKEQGRPEDVQEIRRQAKKVAARLREIEEGLAHGRGPGAEDRHALEIEERLRQIQREVAEAKEHGQEDRAGLLLREGKELKAHLAKLRKARERGPGAEDADVEGLIDRIAKVRKEAVRARRRGAFGEAKELWVEAGRLEEKLHAWMARDPVPSKAPPVEKGGAAYHPDLREDVERLRAEVGELRGLLKRVLEEGGRASRTDF